MSTLFKKSWIIPSDVNVLINSKGLLLNAIINKNGEDFFHCEDKEGIKYKFTTKEVKKIFVDKECYKDYIIDMLCKLVK